MKVFTNTEMQKIDAWARRKLKLPGRMLMENAGRGAADILETYFELDGLKVAIFCGRGNNGGDGFAMARHLVLRGSRVRVILLGRGRDLRGDARANCDAACRLGIPVVEARTAREVKAALAGFRADCVVDAVFGTGFSGMPKGIFRDAIETINKAGSFVFSLDIPSGVDGNTGACAGPVVDADATVTMCQPKRGNYLYPGRLYHGDLHVTDIGIPLTGAKGDFPLATEIEDVFDLLPERPAHGHKGTFGAALVIAGSRGYLGAAVMASRACLRTGAGYVRLAVPEGLVPQLDANAQALEVVKVGLAQTEEETISSQAEEQAVQLLEKSDAVLIGPGITAHPETSKFLTKFIGHVRVPLILDADALNIIARNIRILRSMRAPVVLTPHPGELSRLTGIGVDVINRDRIDIAKKYASEFGGIVALKGAPTIIASSDGRVNLNPNGNSGLAKAGTGDVLAGIIAGLICQRLPAFDAAVAAAFLHGLAADQLARAGSEYSFLASDLIEALPKTMKYVIDREDEDE